MPTLTQAKKKAYRPDKPAHQGNDGSAYNNRRWRRLSLSIRKEYPLCQIAEAVGEVMPSEEVDHIISIKQGGAMYDRRNLIAISKHYHRIKTGKEAHGLSIDYRQTHEGKIPIDIDQVIHLVTGVKPCGEGGLDPCD